MVAAQSSPSVQGALVRIAIAGLLVDTTISAVSPNAVAVDLTVFVVGSLEKIDFSFMANNPSMRLIVH